MRRHRQFAAICYLLSAICYLASVIWLLSNGMAAKKIFVVTTTTDLKALTEAVGGERVQVFSIMRGNQNPHTVQAKPSFVVQLNRAQLFVRIGLDLEIWADQLLEAARNPKIRRGSPGYVDASVGIPLLERPTGPVSREQGEIHIFGNPHYWLDPQNAKIMLNTIADGLKRVSPSDADYFDKNLKAAIKQIDDLLEDTLKQIKPFKGIKVIAYHKTWEYLAHRYGLRIVDYLEPKPGIPPSGKHVAEVIQLMRAQGIKFLIKEPYYEDETPRLVARQTGGKVIELPPSVGAMPGTEDYVKLMRSIINTLVSNFKED